MAKSRQGKPIHRRPQLLACLKWPTPELAWTGKNRPGPAYCDVFPGQVWNLRPSDTRPRKPIQAAAEGGLKAGAVSQFLRLLQQPQDQPTDQSRPLAATT